MLSRIRRLPSPALIIASIALVFAIAGGIGYAASKINGKRIKAHSIAAGKLKDHTLTGRQMKSKSIPGGKLKPNTVTGLQVKESTLGKVPSAAEADHATNADNAAHATNADHAVNADHATSADQATNASTLNGADASNLVSGYATIRAGAAPAVLNSGGKRVSSVSVSRVGTGNYNVTFNGNFPGVTSINQVATSATMWDTDNFDTASASNDQSSANSSAITVRVFTWQTNTATLTDRDFSLTIMTP
jgi:hypothetical protein